MPHVNVPAAPAHVLEPQGVGRPLVRLGASDHRRESDVAHPAALEQPVLVPELVLDDAGGALGEAVRKPTLEEVGGFDDVIVR